MRTVLRAVLLDREAWTPPNPETAGKLREPILRLLALARQFDASSDDDTFYNAGHRLYFFTSQHLLASPSVFNFFLPTHAPAGDIADAGLVAPEFQITTPTTVIGAVNMVDLGIFQDNQLFDIPQPFGQVNLDLGAYVRLADDPEALLDRLDLVMTHGEMHDDTRAAILEVLDAVDEPLSRARHAVYLLSISPDYVVES